MLGREGRGGYHAAAPMRRSRQKIIWATRRQRKLRSSGGGKSFSGVPKGVMVEGGARSCVEEVGQGGTGIRESCWGDTIEHEFCGGLVEHWSSRLVQG
jgi:hypothetical protein